MSDRNWMPFYVGDYIADTLHLTVAEHGAYLLLIFHYWATGSLPADDASLARIARTNAGVWARMRPAVSEFFEMPDWKHKRVEAELQKAAERTAKARRGGLAKAARATAKPLSRFSNPTKPGLLDSMQRGKGEEYQRAVSARSNSRAVLAGCLEAATTKKERESSSATSELGTARERAERGLGEEGFERAAPAVRLNGHPLEVEVRRANGEDREMPTYGEIGATGRQIVNPSGALEDKLFAAAGGNLRGSKSRDVAPIMRRICAGGVNVEADILPAVRELYGTEGAAPLQRWDDPALVAAIERNAAARLAAASLTVRGAAREVDDSPATANGKG